MLLIYFVILFYLNQLVLNQVDTNNYGPYTLSWQKFETCKGPKQTDCGKFEVASTQNMSDVVFHLDFPKDCPATAAKIIVRSIPNDNGPKKLLWNYAINKPCQHFVLGPILMDSFNLTNSCKIDKGNYDIHLNYIEKVNIFLGAKFFYGTYEYKILSFNKNDNFFCVVTIIEFGKKNE